LPTHDAFTSLLSASISQELARLGGQEELVQELTPEIVASVLREFTLTMMSATQVMMVEYSSGDNQMLSLKPRELCTLG
jgi:hypothetical protein